MKARLRELLESGEYLSYAYSYPHKTAYRPLEPAVDLPTLWSHEDRRALFLYVHVPFCEQRCGFCNLFTQVQPGPGLELRYIEALERQAQATREFLGDFQVAQVAVGGGTPSFLEAPLLSRALGVVRSLDGATKPTSIEVSPATLTGEKLAVLREHGVSRVSMGVQSVLPSETSAVQRRQQPAHVEWAVRATADLGVTCNVDLIYGLPGQTADTLRESVDRVIGLGANQLYLYPLYVRPLTILGRRDGRRAWDDQRLSLYRAGRDHLLRLGWMQSSMRMFSAPTRPGAEPAHVAYRCQDDGMIGLGPGARSYASQLHYSTPFAVGQAAVRDRIEEWLATPPEQHALARHGIWLSECERQRRYLVLSLLDRGVVRAEYRTRFGEDVVTHFPELEEAVECGLVSVSDAALQLTERGTERADVLGHWLQSDDIVRARAAWEAA